MLWWAFQNLAVTLALAAAVWLACRVGRLGPVGRHALWLIVLVKLVTPPLVAWPIALPMPRALESRADVSPPPESPRTTGDATVVSPAAPSPEADASPDDDADLDADPAGGPSTDALPAAPPPTSAAPSLVQLTPTAPGTRWLVRARVVAEAVWVAGGVAFALLQGVRLVRLLRIVGRGVPADDRLLNRVEALAARIGVRPPAVRITDGIGSPLVCAAGRPVLLWPAELVAGSDGDTPPLPDAAVRGLILHELAHVKRRDHWVGWLELAAGCVWWWNPLYWYARHQVRENAELACDGWVVGTLPGGRRAYAEGLLAVCECLAGGTALFAGRPTSSAPLPAVGVGSGGRRFLERRLAMILRDRVSLRLPRVGLACLAVLALCSIPVFAQERNDPENPTAADDSAGPGFLQRLGGRVNTAPAGSSEGVAGLRDIPYVGPLYRTSPDGGLPAAAREVVTQFHRQQAEARAEFEKKQAEQREQLVRQLREVQEQLTKDGKLDEAVAVRDYLRRSQNAGTMMGATGGVPGGMMSGMGGPASRGGGGAVGGMGPGGVGFIPGGGGFGGTVEADPGTLTEYRDRVQQRLLFRVTGRTDGTIWGGEAGLYTDDSPLAVAAVHAGILREGQTGVVAVTILHGREQYQGSTANGVTSLPYAEWPGSYRVRPASGPRGTGGVTVGQATEADPGNLTSYRNRAGQSVLFRVTGSADGTIWGGQDGVYTDDSPLAVAAVHSGVLRPSQSGVVRVTILPGRDHYAGGEHNQITSLDYGPWDGSYRIEPANRRARTARTDDAAPRVSAYTLNDVPSLSTFRGKNGSAVIVNVTGTTEGTVWGTDVYTDDSSISAAAVHAGLLKAGEQGMLRVTLQPGQSEYKGSDRNGVSSRPFGEWPGSFKLDRFERPTIRGRSAGDEPEKTAQPTPPAPSGASRPQSF